MNTQSDHYKTPKEMQTPHVGPLEKLQIPGPEISACLAAHGHSRRSLTSLLSILKHGNVLFL